MQFYIVHEDPQENVRLLPEYAIGKVNIREGWQILSDIGHLNKVYWEGQNRLYSASHALTRSFARDRGSFSRFLSHYRACALSRDTTYKERFLSAEHIINGMLSIIPEERAETTYVIEYLLSTKADKLTPEEVDRLKALLP